MGEGRKVHCPWDLFMVSGQMYRGRNVRDTGAFCPAPPAPAFWVQQLCQALWLLEVVIYMGPGAWQRACGPRTNHPSSDT